MIAGGGTGGHLFPGMTVARAVERRLGDAELLFVVGRRPLESELLAAAGFRVARLEVEGLKGRGLTKGLRVSLGLPRSVVEGGRILRAFTPDWVLGMGGYSSGPVCLAARVLGLPMAVHEQNAYPGLTNRCLARIAGRVFVSFEESRPHLRCRTVIHTGNPVRPEFFRPPAHEAAGRRGFTLLVTGGSQGSRAINDAVVKALVRLKEQGKAIGVIHQTGGTDHGRIEAEYRRRGLAGEISAFLHDMPAAYGRADLVIARAGATTVFELSAAGRPAILVPYPHAANRHQERNARALVDRGAAELLLEPELSGERLAALLARYAADPAKLKAMGEKARGLARPDTADVIIDHLLAMQAA